MADYYSTKLAAARLARVYQIAPPRVQQYLTAEIEHVAARIPRPGCTLLELGCGYGRAMKPLLAKLDLIVGIDTAIESLHMARRYLAGAWPARLVCMDAGQMGFRDNCFDIVICIQNGASAFGTDQKQLIAEAVRVCRPGGRVLFSSYSDRFWDHRLDWFRLQSREGLIGEIDEAATGDGVIACKDGFRATTVNKERFLTLVRAGDLDAKVTEVDDSSVFCEIAVR